MNKNINIKYLILTLIDDMNKKGSRAYQRTMNTVLKGRQGPGADNYIDSVAYGTLPDLSIDTFNEEIEKLASESKIAIMTSQSKRVYYIKLSDAYVEDRIKFNDLFGITNDINYNDLRNNDKLYEYGQQRSIDSNSEFDSGSMSIETIDGIKKEVEYESSLERKLMNELSEVEYMKDIVVQPVTIPRGKYGDKKYFPDMLVLSYHNHMILIEVKCLSEMTTDSVLNKYRVLEKYAYDHDMKPVMITHHINRWITLNDIKNRATNRLLEQKVMDKIENNERITNEEYKSICKDIHCDELDIHHIILKNHLKKKGRYNNFYITK